MSVKQERCHYEAAPGPGAPSGLASTDSANDTKQCVQARNPSLATSWSVDVRPNLNFPGTMASLRAP